MQHADIHKGELAEVRLRLAPYATRSSRWGIRPGCPANATPLSPSERALEGR